MTSLSIAVVRKALDGRKVKNTIPLLVARMKRHGSDLQVTQDPIDLVGMIAKTGEVSVVYAAASSNTKVTLDFPDVTVWVIPKFNSLDDGIIV